METRGTTYGNALSYSESEWVWLERLLGVALRAAAERGAVINASLGREVRESEAAIFVRADGVRG